MLSFATLIEDRAIKRTASRSTFDLSLLPATCGIDANGNRPLGEVFRAALELPGVLSGEMDIERYFVSFFIGIRPWVLYGVSGRIRSFCNKTVFHV